jgi:hypothetical protein
MFNPFRIWRHHLANEAHRRIIHALPTARERAQAQERAQLTKLGPPTGRRCSTEEWAAFEARWLPAYREHQRMQLLILTAAQNSHRRHGDDASVLTAQKAIDDIQTQEITWMTLNAFAQRRGAKGARPPRALERSMTTD